MIADTKDIFYLVLSFCVLWFTIFICWLLYYFIAIMRDTRGMVKDVREKVQRVEEAISAVRQKVERSLGAFTLIADGFKYALKLVSEGGYLHRKSKSRSPGDRGSSVAERPGKKDRKGKKDEVEGEVEELMEEKVDQE